MRLRKLRLRSIRNRPFLRCPWSLRATELIEIGRYHGLDDIPGLNRLGIQESLRIRVGTTQAYRCLQELSGPVRVSIKKQ